MRLDSVWATWSEQMKAQGGSGHTLRKYGGILVNHIIYLQKMGKTATWQQVTPNMVLGFLDWWGTQRPNGLSHNTRRDYLAVFKSLSSWMADTYRLPDPLERVKIPRRHKRVQVVAEADEFGAMLGQAERCGRLAIRNTAMLLFLGDTGCRAAEVAGLRVEHLDLLNRQARVIGKGDKQRIVFLSHFTVRALETYMEAPESVGGRAKCRLPWVFLGRGKQRMQPEAVYEVVKMLKTRAGIQRKVTTHAFRRMAATYLLRNGASLEHVRLILGHDRIETTIGYAQLVTDDLQRAHSQGSVVQALYPNGRRRAAHQDWSRLPDTEGGGRRRTIRAASLVNTGLRGRVGKAVVLGQLMLAPHLREGWQRAGMTRPVWS